MELLIQVITFELVLEWKRRCQRSGGWGPGREREAWEKTRVHVLAGFERFFRRINRT